MVAGGVDVADAAGGAVVMGAAEVTDALEAAESDPPSSSVNRTTISTTSKVAIRAPRNTTSLELLSFNAAPT